ncbi:hypothetical protein IV203_004993 [Nitzschia inconspicua]|uniref:Uncharacterized protein n=1 Tax=Nitzschia inconspicua TaxID=303405 RepID=A0A9K3PGJ2_9STRA|nr:hypothetical protein IV203_004993 [Nitzschia inconspicua]
MPSSEPPTAVAGVWQRLWEQDPIGDTETADTTTLVLWTQTPKSGIYVDIRLPKDAPGRSLEDAEAAGYLRRPQAIEGTGITATVDNEDETNVVARFARQKSFAGVLNFSPGDTTTSGAALEKDEELAKLAAVTIPTSSSIPLCTCFWRRDIDYQPPTGGLDIGVCTSGPANADGSIDMRETGSDGSYAELWHRLPGSNDGPFMAMQLLTEDDLPRVGYWVRTGKYFAYAVGRPSDEETATQLGCHPRSSAVQSSSCTGKSLLEAINALDDSTNMKNQLKLLGSYVAVCGELEPSETSQMQWNIKQSTDPGLVGCRLIDAKMEDNVSCSVSTILDSQGTIKSNKELVEVDDILCQTLAGESGKVRKWQVMEISGASHLPGLVA